MSVQTPATTFLQQQNIPHRVFIHPGPIDSLELAARERGQQPEQVIRSIVFRVGEAEFVMVLVSGPGQIPWKALRRYLGQNRLTMATEEELLQTTGCRPGTVSPFGLLQPMRVLVDECILKLEEVSLGSCVRGIAVVIKPADLLNAIQQAEVVNFTCEDGNQ
jgi:Cys-tRNA(Pro)/Cys-tRNA(Cys) deacylase